VEGVYGKYPVTLEASISSQPRNARGNREVFEAAIAFSEMALNERPGGSISPFWDPPTVTSTPHSSCR